MSTKGKIDRRTFLKTVGSAGATVAVAAASPAAIAAASPAAQEKAVLKLEGKVALVTGGGRGIGRGIALALAKAGADIAVIETDVLDSAFNQYLTKDIKGYAEAQKVAEEIKALGRRAMAIKADVSKSDQVQTMVKQTIDGLGHLDILVNNAGVIYNTPPGAMEVDAFDLMMSVNVKGQWLCCKSVIDHMKQRGAGKIINVASIAGKNGSGALSAYCTSKFASVGFTNSLAQGLALDNITVNAICPGVVWTQMWVYLAGLFKQPDQTVEESFEASVKGFIPQGRPQTVEDMGALAVFLATNDNMTGQAINYDGGAQMH